MSDLQDLKKEADELSVAYPKNITAEKLAEKIDAFYKAKESSVITIPESNQVDDREDTPKTEEVSKEELFHNKRRAREKAARVTRVVTIVDNDQRINNHTTTCTVNCSNEYFDLGTMIFPLNEKIEVAMGHIRTLEAVKIPLHVMDVKSGMSSVRMRPRYTVSYENMNK